MDISVVFYTCNYLETQNPHFWAKTQEQLKKAAGEHPIISVSHKPMDLGTNIVFQTDKRSHLNIYRQILTGCKVATSEFVAMAEDDIMYSYAHFHTATPKPGRFLYDMEKVSLFTWTKPSMFTFRTNRRVINQLIANRKLLIEALEERFARFDELIAQGQKEEDIISIWGDIGRYERQLGVTPRQVEEFYCEEPSVVLTHPKAFGFEFNHGKRKKLGDIKIIELYGIGRADKYLRDVWGDYPRE